MDGSATTSQAELLERLVEASLRYRIENVWDGEGKIFLCVPRFRMEGDENISMVWEACNRFGRPGRIGRVIDVHWNRRRLRQPSDGFVAEARDGMIVVRCVDDPAVFGSMEALCLGSPEWKAGLARGLAARFEDGFIQSFRVYQNEVNILPCANEETVFTLLGLPWFTVEDRTAESARYWLPFECRKVEKPRDAAVCGWRVGSQGSVDGIAWETRRFGSSRRLVVLDGDEIVGQFDGHFPQELRASVVRGAADAYKRGQMATASKRTPVEICGELPVQR